MGETLLGTIFFLFLFRLWSALSCLTWCHQHAVCQRMGLSFVASLICRTAVSQAKTIALALHCQSIQGNVLCHIKWCLTGELKTSAVSFNVLFIGVCYIIHRERMMINWNLYQLIEKSLCHESNYFLRRTTALFSKTLRRRAWKPQRRKRKHET